MAALYVQKMDGVVFGKDPRQGYFEANRYFHPQLRFQMSFPEGWKVQDSRSAVRAVSAEEQPTAQMELILMQKNDFSPEQAVAELQRWDASPARVAPPETIAGFPLGWGTSGCRATRVWSPPSPRCSCARARS